MYARSTTIHAEVRSIEAGIAHVRDEVMPALLRIDGCHGLSLLVNRESGQCIATSAWESEEAMRASAEQVHPIRERAAEIFGGTPQVEEWEIAAMHRDHRSHDGARVRVTRIQIGPDQVDQSIEAYRAALPEWEHFEGFCSTSFLVDRASGVTVSSATFDSRDALERTRQRSDAVRTAYCERTGAKALDVEEFELAIANLRVPEMA